MGRHNDESIIKVDRNGVGSECVWTDFNLLRVYSVCGLL